MKVLGIDYGSKRIGLAIGDENLKIAVPLKTIRNDGSTFQEVAKIIEENSVSKVVVGLPLTLSGKEGQRAIEVRSFVNELKKSLPESVEVILWDERFTTEEAYRYMAHYSKRRKKELKDSISALIILQEYLESL